MHETGRQPLAGVLPRTARAQDRLDPVGQRTYADPGLVDDGDAGLDHRGVGGALDQLEHPRHEAGAEEVVESDQHRVAALGQVDTAVEVAGDPEIRLVPDVDDPAVAAVGREVIL